MKLPAAALLLFWVNISFAQTFQPVPAPLLEKEVAFEQANECYIFFNNPSGDTLQLRWRIISISKPENWVIDLCDYGLCYAGIPPNGTMNPVYDTIQPYLKLIVQPDTSAGSAWLSFRVFEKDNESNYVDVYFSLFTSGFTSASEPEKLSFSIFPNPASDVLFIENKSIMGEVTEILNSSGKRMWVRAIMPGEQKMIEVNTWPDGMYYLVHKQQIQKILIQK